MTNVTFGTAVTAETNMTAVTMITALITVTAAIDVTALTVVATVAYGVSRFISCRKRVERERRFLSKAFKPLNVFGI